ncbi:glycosyltransferase [Nonlabens ponticola]|uniref:Glycosyltransferase n=1 Tax=Nonlabens ponticola TaxID=2496866 RepID=A0A3S9N122_9FLAO|nr:glycosyltransferase [Nonlabens ponticola]AZQ45042.1 glycosyltransferase [Nonlabens ponticola]
MLDVFFYLLLGCVLINTFYYFYFSKAATQPEIEHTKSSQPVSIIVCSKNEQENLKELVPLLISQDHPDYEIILINDASSDDTRFVIEGFAATHNNIHLVNVVNNENFWGNKKYALTLGIKKATHDHLVFIDADCRPDSNLWLSHMARPLSTGSDITLGYGGYEFVPKSLLNGLIRFETVFTALQYLGYALRGNAYMGVGRNLAYTSTLFYEQSGFMSHMHIMGGDDDLFVNSASRKANVAVASHPDSFTYSKPKTSWKSWWTQKRRHLKVSKHYRGKHKSALGLFFLSQILFFIVATLALVLSSYWLAILALILCRYVVVYVVMGKGLLRFRESGLIPYIALLEIMLIVAQLGIFTSNLIDKPKHWK